MGRQKHTCPRRAETGMDDPNSPFRGAGRDLDLWIKSHGYVSCSYCGSLHPDSFMGLARSGAAELGPTDKNYKVYVHDPSVTYVPKSKTYEQGKVTKVVKHPRTTRMLKFYFMHLSEDQMREFVELYNARPRRQYDENMEFTQAEGVGMAIGYPGHFYTLPYFMR